MLPLVLAAGIVFSPPSPRVDFDRLVPAIEAREAGSWSNPGGRACWGVEAWREETSLPYRLASDPQQSRIMMRRRLAKFSARLIGLGLEPTVWRLAMAWRWGFDGALRRSRRPDDYGANCEAIYEALLAK